MPDRSTAKTYQPNVALRAVYRKFFEAISVDPSWIESVRELASKGTVVYVLRNLNFVDFLALDHLTKQFGLPQVRFANDLGLWILNPLGEGLIQALTPGGGSTPAEHLREAVEAGGSAALFLKRPPGMLDLAAGAGGGGTARARRGREPESRDDGDPGRMATARTPISLVKPSDHCLILPGIEPARWKMSIAQHTYEDFSTQYLYEKLQRHNLVTETRRPGLSPLLLELRHSLRISAEITRATRRRISARE